MQLRDWRLKKGLNCAELARSVGIAGVNPGGTLSRIEAGARQPEADLTQRIIAFAGGEVTAADMHAVRLAWLKANRPEKFRQPDADPPIDRASQDADRVSTAAPEEADLLRSSGAALSREAAE